MATRVKTPAADDVTKQYLLPISRYRLKLMPYIGRDVRFLLIYPNVVTRSQPDRHSATLMAGVLLLLILVNAVFAFDRDVCLKTAQYMLGNRTLDASSSYFYYDRTGGFPYSGNDNMTLTLQGSDALCGSKQTWYTDIGPRLSI
jgi:hypothetical protein